MIRVLIADDHQLTRSAVKAALEASEGIKVVAEVESGRQALAATQRFSPDVSLLDLHMPGAIDGLTCAERIRKRFPKVRVVIISGFTDEASVRMAFRRGAHAFVSKAIDPDDLGAALRLTVRRTAFHAAPGSEVDAAGLVEGLTEREATVLKAVAAGLSNQAISERLFVTENTIKFHLTNIFRKLEVSNRTEAACWAQQRGLVEDLADQPVAGPVEFAVA